jgi:hypothetical protein
MVRKWSKTQSSHIQIKERKNIIFLLTWFPREGTTWWTIHCESTTPIFSWAGCCEQRREHSVHTFRNSSSLEWYKTISNNTYLHAFPESKIQAPTMNQVILHPKAIPNNYVKEGWKIHKGKYDRQTWIICHTHLHASLEKTGAIISTKL